MVVHSLTSRSLALLISLVTLTGYALELHVAPDGNDGNPGTAAKPFASLTRARDAARESRKSGVGPVPVTVWVHDGVYELRESFVLETNDSGTTDAPVVYRASGPGETRLVGGRTLSPEAFSSVTDAAELARIPEEARGSIQRCDLRKLGITEYGQLTREALNGGAMLELFFNEEALPLSRWPNSGWAKYGKVIDKGSVPRFGEEPDRPGVCEYTGDRPVRWKEASEIWLHGYWHHDWYDDVLKVAKLDTEARRITFTTPHLYGLVGGRRYAALNLLEEVDAPGEWMLDRTTGVLYLYPPSPMAGARIAISMLADPLIQLNRTQHVTIRGFVLEMTRGSGVVVSGGTDNLVASCVLRNIGTSAISIRPAESALTGPLHHLHTETGDPLIDGRRNGVVGCDLYDVGTSGISLSGGDRRKLLPAGHFAVNNDIQRYSRRKRTNCPAIGLNGVGNRMAHNFIHDAPHCGVFYSGNDHVIEFNEATRLCLETGDVGVFYSGRNWTYRGNVIRHNYIHHIRAPGRHGSMAVYLDDSHSSTHIAGNVFYKVQYAAFIGGGHDNVVENNIFVDCSPAVHLDNRSQGWAHKYQKRGGDHKMYAKLDEIDHDQPPHSERYPSLAKILDSDPHAPSGNVAIRNVCVRGKWLDVYRGGLDRMTVEDNFVTKEDPGFVDMAGGDLRLRPDSVVVEKVPGFKPVPFGEMGLRVDEYRPSLPLTAPRIRPDGGGFLDEITIELLHPAENVQIRYTLGGGEPKADSVLYTGPFGLTDSATVRARVFPVAGGRPSPVAEAGFRRIEFRPGGELFLSDVICEDSFAHGGLKRDTNYLGTGPVRLGGKEFAKGILIHVETVADGKAESYAIYDLTGPLSVASRFEATVGVDDGGDARGSVVFAVAVMRNGAWHEAFRSGVLRGGAGATQVEVDVDVTGAEKLKLMALSPTGDISSDHAAWGNARVVR